MVEAEARKLEAEVHKLAADAEAFSTEASEGITDCGTTLCCMGDRTWEQWPDLLARLGLKDSIEQHDADKVFRFGNGDRLQSRTMVRFPVKVLGHEKTLDVYLVPGSTPLLVARPVLEKWGAILDFRKKALSLSEFPR